MSREESKESSSMTTTSRNESSNSISRAHTVASLVHAVKHCTTDFECVAYHVPLQLTQRLTQQLDDDRHRARLFVSPHADGTADVFVRLPKAPHAAGVLELGTSVSNWAQRNGLEDHITVMSDGQLPGLYNGANINPDVTVMPNAYSRAPRGPRLVIEMEVGNRHWSKLRRHGQHLLEPTDDGVPSALRVFVAVKFYDYGAAVAAMFVCNDGSASCASFWDFGTVGISAQTKGALSKDLGEDTLPPVTKEMLADKGNRYTPIDGGFTYYETPRVSISGYEVIHNVPDCGAVDNLVLDLARLRKATMLAFV